MQEILPRLNELTLDEKVYLLSGADYWRTQSYPNKNIPAVKLSDGPNGIRGDLSRPVSSACLPVGVAMGASWDPGLVAEAAGLLAEEAKEKSVHVVLGPTINLQRTPVGGRNFECYSEDPYLTGKLGTAFVNGLQSKGIGACPKHFVGNDTEYERFTISSEIDERTLRAVYLLPFEMVVRESKPWMIMSAYNKVNGVFSSSQRPLLVDTLKKKWGFDGVVVSDWTAAKSTLENAIGGLDLEMPGPPKVWGQKLVDAAKNGLIDESEINDKVERVLHLINRSVSRASAPSGPERACDLPERRAFLRRAAAQTMVLMKNGVLPLPRDLGGRIAVIGPNAKYGQIMGGGSSRVYSHPPTHPLDGIRATFPQAKIEYQPGCAIDKFTPLIDTSRLRTPIGGVKGIEQRIYKNSRFEGAPLEVQTVPTSLIKIMDALDTQMAEPIGIVLEADYTAEASGIHTLGICSVGKSRWYINGELAVDNWSNWQPGNTFYTLGNDEELGEFHFSEGQTYRFRVEYERMPGGLVAGLQFGIRLPQDAECIAKAVALAKAADKTIVIVGTNSDWETEGLDRQTMDLPGDQNKLVKAVLEVSPDAIVILNVGSATAMPWYEAAGTVLVSWFGGLEMGSAIGDVLSGHAEPAGRLPFTWPTNMNEHPAMEFYPGEPGRMTYGEGCFIGYRGFFAKGIKPLAPFGHGGSFGASRIASAAMILKSGGAWLANCSLQNGSDKPSSIVVQVYADTNFENSSETLRTLIGFGKFCLDPHEGRDVIVGLDFLPVRRLISADDIIEDDQLIEQMSINVGTTADGPFVEVQICR